MPLVITIDQTVIDLLMGVVVAGLAVMWTIRKCIGLINRS